MQMLDKQTISFVACSKWLQGEARRSGLLKGQRVDCIPNPIDTHVFRPIDKQAARERLNLPADRRLRVRRQPAGTGHAGFFGGDDRRNDRHPV